LCAGKKGIVNNEKYQTHIGCLEKEECCTARWGRKEVIAT
jgi:hypothetical protein